MRRALLLKYTLVLCGTGTGLFTAGGGAGGSGPGGASDVLLLSNNTDGLLLVDGASFLKLASSL